MTTDDEVRAECVRVMGAELGNLQFELQLELYSLRYKWREYQEIFTDDEDQRELLNRVAPNFFHIVHRLFYEDAMLHLSRLTDPESSRGYMNLSLKRLPAAITDQRLKARVTTALATTVDICAFARKWRDKQLAHSDLIIYRNDPVSRLPKVDTNDIEEGIESMRLLLNIVDAHFGRPLIMWPFHDPWASRSLLHYLKKGAAAVDVEEQKMKANRPADDAR